MQDRARRATAVGATAFVLAGSAVLGMPGTASADTVTANCGDTVTVKPGDLIKTPLGIKTVTDLLGGVLGALCKITVKVVDTAVAPVPVVGAPVASAVNGAVADTTNGLGKVTDDVGKTLSGDKQQSPAPGSGGNPQQNPPSQGGAPQQGGTPQGTTPIPEANSPLLPGFFPGGGSALGGFPFTLGTGYAPMRDYSGIPYATAGLFTPSPAIRYGSQIPGYAPQYGLNGPDGTADGNGGVQTAGEAQALPSASDGFTNGSNLPMLIAVLALSGVSAGLVRTWVLRRMAAAN